MPGESNRILLISTWGDPYSWRPAKYRLIDLLGKYGKRNRYLDETYESTTTLTPLIKYFGERSSALVLALDTVAFNTEAINGFDQEKELSDKFNEYLGKDNPTYTDIVEYSKYCIKYYIERKLDQQLLDKIDIEVLPGIGVFKGKYAEATYRDRPINYYMLSYISILKKLLSVEPDKIVLDITHGINFMPVLTYRAVLSAARTYVLIKDIDTITIYVVNSDPYPRASRERRTEITKPELNINLIRKIAITQREAYWRITRELLTRRIGGNMLNPIGGKQIIDKELEEIYRRYLDLCRAARRLIFSYDYGLILPLLYIHREIKDNVVKKEILENYGKYLLHGIPDIFRQGKLVEKKGQSYIVEGFLEITENVESSLYTIALLNHIEELNPDTIVLGDSILYNIRSIQEIANKIKNILAVSEVNRITKWIKKNEDKANVDRPKTLLELGYDSKQTCREKSEEEEKNKKETEESMDKQERNFLAHGGFEKSLTYIVYCNRKHYIGYLRDTYDKAMKIADHLVKEAWKPM